MKTLFVDKNADKGTLLVTDSGDPVWPVCSIKELAALQKTAEIFDSKIEFIQGTPGRSNPLNQVVMVLGDELVEEALLYAHLTRRQLKKVNTEEQLLTSPIADILIIAFNDLTDKILSYLYKTKRSVAPGIIISYEGYNFRSVILSKSASLQLSGNASYHRIDINAISSYKSYQSSRYEVYGSGAEPTLLREALKKKKTLLNIITHSDGIDAYFGKITLCPLLDSHDSNIDRPPNCLCTEICHRQKLPIDEAIEKNSLISTNDISAQIVTWMSCRGLRLNPSMINPLWGLAPRFLNNPAIGAMVAPWKIVFTHIEYAADFAAYLENGATLGEAVAKFNHSELGTQKGLRMCLMGDSGIQLQNVTPTPSYTILKPKEVSLQQTKEIAFLRHYLKAVEQKHSKEIQSFSKEAITALEEYEYSLSQTVSKEDQDAKCQKMQQLLMNVLLRSGSEAIVTYVDLLKNLSLAPESKNCFVCETEEVETYQTFFHLPSIDVRKVAICPNCGIIQESSSSSKELSFQIKESRIVELKGDLPKENWTAVLFLHYKLKEQCYSFNWPEDDTGKPRRIIDTNIDWPKGPVYVTLFFMEETKLTILRHPFST